LLEIVSEDALIPVAAGEPIHLSFTGKVVWKIQYRKRRERILRPKTPMPFLVLQNQPAISIPHYSPTVEIM